MGVFTCICAVACMRAYVCGRARAGGGEASTNVRAAYYWLDRLSPSIGPASATTLVTVRHNVNDNARGIFCRAGKWLLLWFTTACFVPMCSFTIESFTIAFFVVSLKLKGTCRFRGNENLISEHECDQPTCIATQHGNNRTAVGRCERKRTR